MENGLSNNYVVDITQDSYGCIWIATESGLNRFDGHNFQTYTIDNSALSSNELNKVVADPDAQLLWIGTQRDGLCIFNYETNSFEVLNRTNSQLSTNDITDIVPVKDKGVWIIHYHSTVDFFNKNTQEFTAYKEFGDRKCWTLETDNSGLLYVGHFNGGMTILNPATRDTLHFISDPSNPDGLPGDDVKSICIDSFQNVWVGTNNGLALFNPKTKKFKTFRHIYGNPASLPSNTISDIKQMRDGRLWITTLQGGVSILDLNNLYFNNPEDVHFFNITTETDLKLGNKNAKCLYEDSYGNIWIGTYQFGLDVVNHTNKRFKTIKSTQINHANPMLINSIYIDEDDYLWVGRTGIITGLKQNKSVKECQLYSSPGTSNATISSIYNDSKGMLWLSTIYDDVYRYNRELNKATHLIVDPDKKIELHCFLELPDKQQMLIGSDYGIYFYDYQTQKIGKYEVINNQMADNVIYSMLIDDNHQLWVGTFDQGIALFDAHMNKIKEYKVDNGFISNAVNHLYLDSKKHVWAATRDGLVQFKTVNNSITYKVYNKKQGIYHPHVSSITEDLDGNIWISTNSGISMWNADKEKFNNYTFKDELPIGVFMKAAAARDQTGQLYFVSQNGICYFQPQDVINQISVPRHHITNFLTYGKNEKQFLGNWEHTPVNNGVVDLNYQQNTFRIEFNVTDITLNTQVEYSYKMEGLSAEWYNLGSENSVVFHYLPAGNYTFMVKSRLRNNEWDENIISLTIKINPPLYFSWWAKLFYLLLFIILAGIVIKVVLQHFRNKETERQKEEKQKHEKHLNNERLRFFTNIAHEIRTPLTLILGPLEDLTHDASLGSKQTGKINIIHQSAINLLNLANQLLEFRKTETQNKKLNVHHGDVSSFLRGIYVCYKELNNNPKLQFILDIPSHSIEIFFDDELLAIVLNNLMSNATKFTEQGTITLGLKEISNEFIEIYVKDTGYGISKENIKHIFDPYYQAEGKHHASGTGIGLALVSNLVNIHQGEISVQSEPDKGSNFTIKLSCTYTYPNSRQISKETAWQTTEDHTASVADKQFDQEMERPILLVVEDNSDIRNYIYDSLSDSFEVLTTDNGQKGLEIALNKVPQIIVSDIMMPLMDGIELCKAIKTDLRTSHIPVVLLTAKDSFNDRNIGYEAGADSYLTKPFSSYLLETRIFNLLESRKKLARSFTPGTINQEENPENEILRNKMISKIDREFIHKLVELVENNLENDKIDIAFLSENLYMSHSTLYRKVKALTDLSPNEFVRIIRLKHAKELLLSQQYSISEVIIKVGFNSLSYFRQCFKDVYGLSPAEYGKNAKNG